MPSDPPARQSLEEAGFSDMVPVLQDFLSRYSEEQKAKASTKKKRKEVERGGDEDGDEDGEEDDGKRQKEDGDD